MRHCVVACETLKDELLHAMQLAQVDHEVIWIPSGLHNTPSKLTDKLQEVLDSLSGFDRVLLCFGTCGNSVLGLKIGAYETILPRVDDCITLLLGSFSRRIRINEDCAAYYLTEGWLRGERNLWVEYQHCVDTYGIDVAEELAKELFGHYRSLALLDTGIDRVEELVEATRTMAETLKLEQIVVPATTAYIVELLAGPWPQERFIVKAPHSVIESSDLLF